MHRAFSKPHCAGRAAAGDHAAPAALAERAARAALAERATRAALAGDIACAALAVHHATRSEHSGRHGNPRRASPAARTRSACGPDAPLESTGHRRLDGAALRSSPLVHHASLDGVCEPVCTRCDRWRRCGAASLQRWVTGCVECRRGPSGRESPGFTNTLAGDLPDFRAPSRAPSRAAYSRCTGRVGCRIRAGAWTAGKRQRAGRCD